jgi:hypothetical protein
MQPSLKPKKQESVLRQLSRINAQPINAQTALVVGIKRQTTKVNIQANLKALRVKLGKTTDSIQRKLLESEVKQLDIKLKFGQTPGTDQRAIERALRALERSKWERENR